LLEALKISEENRMNEYTYRALSGIADIYINQKSFSKATEYAQKNLSLARRQSDKFGEAIALQTLGGIALVQADSTSAKLYYLSSLHVLEQVDDKLRKANAFANLGSVEKDLVKAAEYRLSAKNLFDSIDYNGPVYVMNLVNMGEGFLKIAMSNKSGKFQKISNVPVANLLAQAETYLQEAFKLGKENDVLDMYAEGLLVLSKVQEYKGDYKNALQSFQAGKKIQDSLFSQENKNEIASIESRREIELRDTQLQMKELALTNVQRTRTALIAGSALLLIIGGLLFYQNRNRKKTNTALLTLNNKLNEANKAKTTFFSILSHDLRSPIADLIGFLHLQKNMPQLYDEKNAEQRQAQLTGAAENLLDNMEAILLWSKSQMERFAPQKRTMSADNFFSYLQKQFSETAGIKISFANPQNPAIHSDEDYLKTIMYNLTANAVKAWRKAETQGASIEWTAAETENGGVALTIADNGPGIKKEQLEALYNENSVIGTRFGLGLHLIRDMAKAIGCKVEYTPAPAGGARFLLLVN
jgi:signal transduction histidine kinase